MIVYVYTAEGEATIKKRVDRYAHVQSKLAVSGNIRSVQSNNAGDKETGGKEEKEREREIRREKRAYTERGQAVKVSVCVCVCVCVCSVCVCVCVCVCV